MSRSRKLSNLHATTSHRLTAYALSASAAGVSLLALTEPCEAQIVYTPAHVTIGRRGSYGLDLNNDGKIDFTIFERVGDRGFGTYQELNIIAAQGNKIECSGGGGPSCAFTVTYAAALVVGARIGEGPRDSTRMARPWQAGSHREETSSIRAGGPMYETATWA